MIVFTYPISAVKTRLSGSFAVPCRTLPQALLLVNDGDKICLNGTNSESNPYECLKTVGPNGTKLRAVGKSVSIQGVSSPARVGKYILENENLQINSQ